MNSAKSGMATSREELSRWLNLGLGEAEGPALVTNHTLFYQCSIPQEPNRHNKRPAPRAKLAVYRNYPGFKGGGFLSSQLQK